MTDSITDDACAILLLCAYQGGEEEFRPLEGAEYNQLAAALYQSGKRPRDLLTMESIPEVPPICSDRLRWLLGRRINLGFSLEEWQRKGYWVLARSDEDYPKAIRAGMRNHAPPLLFGTGNQSLLNSGGMAIFGPDTIPDGRIKKACASAAAAAKEGRTVIAAGHLKMARRIVETVHEHSGCAIWVLHEGALKQRLKKSHRKAIRSSQLVMITTQSPKTSQEAGQTAVVGSLAAGFAENILYIDGSYSKTREDRFEITASVMKRLEDSRLLCGRRISPEGKRLKGAGISVWENEKADTKRSQARGKSAASGTNGDRTGSGVQGELF